MFLSVKGDVKRVVRDLRLQDKKLIGRARQNALNKVGAEIRKQVIRRTASEVGLAQKWIRPRVKKYSKPYKAKITLWMGLSPIPVYKVTRGGKKPMSGRAEGKIMARFTGSPFLATMASGHKGWFARKPGSRHKPGLRNNPDKPELPIGEVVFNFKEIGKRALTQISETVGPVMFEKEFIKDIQKQLAKNKPNAR